jgi:siroheme synthase
MGVSNVEDIQNGLMQSMPSDTPAAILHKVTLPSQKIKSCSLGNLFATVSQAEIESPSIIVIGDVLSAIKGINQDKEFKNSISELAA